MTYHQVANENLKDLRLQTCPASKELLQDADEHVAHWGTDEGAVYRHLRYATCEVVPVFILIMCQPRSEELLQCCQSARSQHLGAQRVLLKLLQIGL